MPSAKAVGGYVGPNKILRAFKGDRRVIGRGPWVGGSTVRTNLAYNPFALQNFNNGASNYPRFKTDRFGGASTTYTRLLDQTDGPTPEITSYARATIGTTTGSSRGYHLVGNPESTAVTDLAPITAGEPYVFSVWARYSENMQIRLQQRFTDGTTASMGSVNSIAPAVPGAQWQRISIVGVAPAGSIGFTAYLVIQGTGPTGATLDATGLVYERGATQILPAFSGETINDPGSTGYAYEFDWIDPNISRMETKTDYRVRDNFNRSDVTGNIGPFWTTNGGLKLSGSRLTTTNATTVLYHLLPSADVMSPDMEVSANLTRGTSGSAGFSLRYADSANHIGVRLGNSNNLLIFRTQSGSTTSLSGLDLPNWVEGSKLTARIQGSTITALVNDVVVAQATDVTMSPAMAASKVYSIRVQGSTATTTPPYYDNFEAFSLS